MKYRDNNFYIENKCELMLGKTAKKIDADKKQVILDDGEYVSYDNLLIATGSSPFIPPIKGLDDVKNKFAFTTLDDAKQLENVLKKNMKVLIVGAGLIGLKCAEGISKKNLEITCVDLSPKILSSILDNESSEVIKRHLIKNKIKFFLEKQIVEFNDNVAYLNDNTKIPFDVLVMAVGVRPNISLLKDIGGETNRGIFIDERCKTSIPNIYAAGDCCESLDASSGEKKLMALLPNAYMQGECAGNNMSGKDHVFDKAIPMNAIGLFGKHIITAGTYTGEVYYEADENNYKKLFYSNNRLNGFIMIGDIEKAGIYTALIRDRIPLDTLDFELICKMPGLMAFSKEERAGKLGGVLNDAISS
jgi:NAD(P)H-nitrite reductase large subunit